MGFPWPAREYPGARYLCSRYLEQSPFDAWMEHIDWADHPLAAVQEANEEYRRWRNSGAGPLRGDGDPGKEIPWRPGGRGTASQFRASWSRTCGE
jgi:hypothetical protein